MKRIFIISCFTILMAFMARASSFEEANAAYKEGNYSMAVELYEALSEEHASAIVHYNLGNSYYKTGDAARAILHYEKALRFAPSDEDIQHNLKIANLMVIDKIEATPEFFLLTWWKGLANRMPADVWTVLFLILLWISILLFLAFAFVQARGKKLMFFSGSAGMVVAVLLVLLSITRHNYDTDNSNAVILSSSVSVKSAPVNSGTDLFIIHEGLKVKVLDKENDWLRIKLADGKEGWVAETVLERI